MSWNSRVNVKHLFTDKSSHSEIQKSMSAIADVLKRSRCFNEFELDDFYNIPKGDNFFTPEDYANRMLNNMYDFADSRGIWIE